jgi:peptide/nickel transport system substrate-binding protein
MRYLPGFLAAVLVIGIATWAPVFSAPGGSQLVVAQGADIQSADPLKGDTGVEFSVYFQMCDPLVNYDKDWNLVPALATSWKAVDPLTYDFTLRSGAKFQDGTPVTAADVKFTMDRFLDPKFNARNATDFVEIVKSTEVVGPAVVRFRLKVPYASFVYQMPYIFPVSQQAVTKLGDEEFARHPICAGAYRLVEWVPDDHVLLEASDHYWAGRPKVDRIVIKPIPSSATRSAALRSGEVDVAVNLSPDQVPAVEKDAKLRILAKETGRMEFFIYNTNQKPFDDKRVRQALNYAVDWDAIVKSIMGGYGRRVVGPAMPYMFGYKPVTAYPYDPTKAKSLLGEAGYGNGFDLTVESPNGRYFQDKEIAQAVVGYLQRVGVRATLQTSEWGQHSTRKRTLKWQIGLWGFVSLYHQLDDVGFHFEPQRGANLYSNPELTKLFEAGRMESDQAKRKAIYGKAIDLLVDEAPWLYGVAVLGPYGVNRRVTWEPRSGSDILFDLNRATLR